MILLCFLCTGLNAQTIPVSSNLTGRLTENGNPIDGQRNLTISIGSFWSETITTNFTDGNYSIQLGSTPSNPIEISQLRNQSDLQITISLDGGNTIIAAIPVSSVLYARVAEYAETAGEVDGLVINDLASKSGDQAFNGQNTFTNTLRVGSPFSPQTIELNGTLNIIGTSGQSVNLSNSNGDLNISTQGGKTMINNSLDLTGSLSLQRSNGTYFAISDNFDGTASISGTQGNLHISSNLEMRSNGSSSWRDLESGDITINGGGDFIVKDNSSSNVFSVNGATGIVNAQTIDLRGSNDYMSFGSSTIGAQLSRGQKINDLRLDLGPTGVLTIFGSLAVTETVSKSGGTFMIDHPDDPENKYLYHSFVESPDMMNIYNGNVETDEEGLATISLPDYFNSLNIDFRYQLTPIGVFSQAIVMQEINGNSFQIKTDKPNVKVSWQVTGIRNDRYARENRVVPVVDKPSEERGTLLYNGKIN